MATGIHCKNYDGRAMLVEQKPCKAGVDPILSFCDNNSFGWVKRAPCFRDNAGAPHCPAQIFPTAAEVEAENAAFEDRINDFMKWMPIARKRILAVAREKNIDAGTIDCPKCGKRLRWRRARSNGHVHGHCETEGCLQWME